MLDKLKFNNLVISNKKGIEQSRIQTINKLVHKLRKLKILLEKHPENTKCKERIRKSTETMEVLKKLKRMDIMKNMLLMDRPAGSVISNSIATPDEVAVALLSMNKVMQGLVTRFKTELQINKAANDEWKQVLKQSSKRMLKIERTEEKSRKRLELKRQKAIGRKREEWLKENQGNIGESVSFEDDVNFSIMHEWKNEELTNGSNANKHDNVRIKETKPPIRNKLFADNTFPLSNKKSKIASKEKTRDERKKMEELETFENEERFLIVNSQPKESSSGKKDDTESLVVDPFFITDNGDNYLSTALIKRDVNEDKANEERKDLHMIKLNNRSTDFRNNRHEKRDKNYKMKTREAKVKWNSEDENHTSKFLQHKAIGHPRRARNSEQQKYEIKDEKNLHPSWAAKQKQKPIITEFQGRKITFDDHFNQSNVNQKEINSKKSASVLNTLENDSLHPSWAAKQKLRPVITSFQGKKTIFDNNE